MRRSGGRSWQSLVGCVAGILAGLVLAPAGVASAAASSSPAEGSGASSFLESPLVIQGSPTEGAQLRAQARARLANPGAVAEREASRTRFEGLNDAQARQEAAAAFPGVVNNPAGGPPRLPVGQRIRGFANANVAQVDLGGGQRGVIESTVPMATLGSGNVWKSVDLGLREVSGAFEPANPLVGVRIPKRLADGVEQASTGLSLTPVAGSGAPLSGSEGSLRGAVVLYANTQTDTDTLAKPTTWGFDLEAVLRSVRSPERFYYRVGMPVGARLVQDKRFDMVRVVKEGATLATVPMSSAHDAAGTAVAVQTNVSGNTLIVSVAHHSGSYQYPIEMDPEFNVTTESLATANWHFTELSGGKYEHQAYALEKKLWISHQGSFSSGDWADWAMETRGDSKIYEATVSAQLTPAFTYGYWKESPANFSTALLLGYENEKHESVTEKETVFSGAQEGTEWESTTFKGTVCAAECATSTGHEHNFVRILQTSIFAGSNPASVMVKNETNYISQPAETHSTVAYNYSSPEIEYSPGQKTVNVLYSGGWIGPNSGALEYTSKDLGLGVAENKVEYLKEGKWESYLSKNFLAEQVVCQGVQCESTEKEALTYASLKGAFEKSVNGISTIRVAADDPMAKTWSSEHGEGESVIKVDAAPPHALTISGLAKKGEELEISEVEGHIKAEASDGEGSVPSSGIRSIALYVDGMEYGKSTGYCSPGPCTRSGEWAINGGDLGAGTHTLGMRVIDNAGNETVQNYVLNVYPASPVSMGPGSVNPESGNFGLGATDVNLSGGMGSLTVARSYDSRNLTEGKEGPLGPQWAISLGSLAGLEVLPDGSVITTGPSGITHFTKNGSAFEAPKGDTNLTLESKHNAKEEAAYYLKNLKEDTTTEFTLPSGAKLWMPTASEGPVATDTMTDSYKTIEPEAGKKIVEPTLELAPHPSAVCEPKKTQTEKTKMEKGCRALEFTYATETTAKGEGPSEWGQYNGRLVEVVAIVYNPSTKEMAEPAIAKYEYDKQGRLRAEWDPRISPTLKTTYGYDAEGHVTVVSAPGVQPWLMHYGTIEGDAITGRLLSVTRPAASTTTELKEAEARGLPSNTALPTLSSTSPVEGTSLSVSSNGTWTNSPLAYSYQWENCWVSTCYPILGATNSNYRPTSKYVNQKLKVVVTATNADGSVTVATAETGEVKGIVPTYVSEFGAGTLSKGMTSEYATAAGATAATVAPSGNVWVANAEKTSSKLYVYSASGTLLNTYSLEGVATGIAFYSGASERVYVADAKNSKVWELNTSGTVLKSFSIWEEKYNEKIPDWIAVGVDSSGRVWTSDYRSGNVEEYESSGTRLLSFKAGGEKKLTGLAINSEKKYVYAATGEGGGREVLQYSLSGTFLKRIDYIDPANNIAFAPYNSFLYDFSGKTVSEYHSFAPAQLESSCLGNCEELPITSFGSGHLTEVLNLAVTSSYLYAVDHGAGEVEKWTAPHAEYPSPTPPALGASAVSTIDYGVPMSGPGVPILSAGATEAWGQTDNPQYATAIFPPDEPMGWPAADYKRATIYYMDGNGRTVNVASPSGGISTSEYNENNEVVRSLSAENRATALEGSKSAEVSKLLDTRSEYSTDGSQLLETWGPQHSVKLANGTEVTARGYAKYAYDQGAPTEETYDLATETETGAETAAKEKFDVRKANTAYGDQGNLGWKLRSPTSVTVDPGGAALKHTTVYEENGNVKETVAPAATSAKQSLVQIIGQMFGSYGSGEGHFEGAMGMTTDSSGNVYVADYNLNRVEKFSQSGSFIAWIGSATSGSGEGQLSHPESVAVSAAGNIYVGDAGNHRVEEFNSEYKYVRSFGGEGTAGGKFGNEMYGMVVNSENLLLVTDGANHRIEEFSATGTYERSYGAQGTGAGQFEDPRGIAASSGNLYVTDFVNDRVEKLSISLGLIGYIKQFGSYGLESGQLREPWGIAIDSKQDVYVADKWPDVVEEFTNEGKFLAWVGSSGTHEGQFENPEGVATNSSDALYVADFSNNRVDEWVPGNSGTHTMHTIYYTAGSNINYPSCEKHIEWVNLPCQTQPNGQPGTLPELPKTRITYNMWDQPEVTTEYFGTNYRKKTTTFDGAGRGLTSEVVSVGLGGAIKSLPLVTDKYNAETGALEEQSAGAHTLTHKYDTLGRPTSYTDADGNVSKYTYDIDGRVETATSGKGEEAKSTQTYTFDSTTGFLAKLVDSGAGTFTAEYDAAGVMTKEVYPNAMTATYTHNQVGETTSVEYRKTAHCKTTCPETWFSDVVTPSIHGEMLKQVSTLATEEYTYDTLGRLTQTQETPVGKGCVTRVYTYDEESNRTNLSTRNPLSEGKCAGEGGATEHGEVQRHSYDTANRLTDYGVQYDTIGDTAKLPAIDAGGTELTSEYYVDSQVYKQEQNGETIEYLLDPENRTRETISSGTTASKVISHYGSSGSAVLWTSEGSGKWTRNIPDINGEVAAVETSGSEPVLQLHDLGGNIVATAAKSETVTELQSKYNSTEFGVPVNGTPPKYSWLGAEGITGELPSGVIAHNGTAYVPQIARPLQTTAMPLPAPTSATGQFVSTIGAGAGDAGEEAAHLVSIAEEARKAAIEMQCVESGACSEDPPVDGLLSPAEVGKLETTLHNDIVEAELLAEIVGSRESQVQKLILAFLKSVLGLTAGEYQENLEHDQESVEQCSSRVSALRPSGRCYLRSYEDRLRVPILGTIWYMITSFEIQDCPFDRYSKWDHYNYYSCMGSGGEQREYRYRH